MRNQFNDHITHIGLSTAETPASEPASQPGAVQQLLHSTGAATGESTPLQALVRRGD